MRQKAGFLQEPPVRDRPIDPGPGEFGLALAPPSRMIQCNMFRGQPSGASSPGGRGHERGASITATHA